MTDAKLRRLLDRFTVGDDCWEWTGVVDPTGYGRISGKSAHRAVYAALAGPIPDRHHLHHRCRNRLCVRPAHLEPIAAREHMRLHGEALREQSRRTVQRSGITPFARYVRG